MAGTNDIKAKIQNLKVALEERLPNIKTILADIHKHMLEEPEVVTASSEEEIETVVRGLIAHANIEIPVSKSPSSKKKTPISAGDL